MDIDPTDPELTAEPYHPSDDVEPILETAAGEVRIETDEPQELSIGPLDAIKSNYWATYRDETVHGHETTSALGYQLSIEGELGTAATVVLVSALQFGVPTLLYLDELPGGDGPVAYHDLTAEWYRPPAAEQGIPAKRMDHHEDVLDAERVSIEELETWVWALHEA